MSEHFLSCQNTAAQQIEMSATIGTDALEIVDRTYGTGYPQWREGSHELAYHNGHHSRAVGKAAAKVSTALGLSSVEIAIARTAGLAHDIVQGQGRGADEHQSAQWLEEKLATTNLFPPQLRRMGALAILGTEPQLQNGRLVGQKANQLTYPSKTAELVAKSVACGDLGDIYMPQGPFLAHQLFREIHGTPSERDIPFDKIIAFQRNQQTFLGEYQYSLVEAEKLLATHRKQVIAYVDSLVHGLESGAIESWNELIARDLAFIQSRQN